MLTPLRKPNVELSEGQVSELQEKFGASNMIDKSTGHIVKQCSEEIFEDEARLRSQYKPFNTSAFFQPAATYLYQGPSRIADDVRFSGSGANLL